MSVLLIKKPSALIPIALSLAAIALVLGHAAIFGIVHQADEGTPAHIFQLLLATQGFAMAVFAAKWLPNQPRQSLGVLVLHATFGIIAIGLACWLT